MQGCTAAAAGGRAAAGQMNSAVHEGRAGDAMHGDGQGFEGIPAILRLNDTSSGFATFSPVEAEKDFSSVAQTGARRASGVGRAISG